jgi:hypothetical protein
MEMMRRWLALVLCALASARAADRILILRAEGAHFQETTAAFKRELGPEFQCDEHVLGNGEEAAPIQAAAAAAVTIEIGRLRPKAVVLMDNDAIKLYAQVQKLWRDSVPFPPSISLMAIRVDEAIAELRRAGGIFYEVPGVTILVNLRSLVLEPVRRVGVIMRPSMADFVRESAKWCKRENIELVPFEVPEDRRDVARAVRTGVRRLRERENVDALWILNDNFFLTADIIGSGWLPALEGFRKPVLVGVENFVSARSRFGTFAILPDHYGLGVQAAGMILRLKEDGWEFPAAAKVEQPLAVLKILNLEQARKSVHIRESALLEVDKVIR